MIGFATLFLGLVFGVVSVELDVAAGVHSVNLLLDGSEVAALRPPWQARIDLGAALSPHELVAVAFDSKGRELDRARQWINRPRAVAEAGFVLEPGTEGRGRVARLRWMCVAKETPRSITFAFDGKPIAVSDPRRIELPPQTTAGLHFLRAELDFGGGVSAVADAVFGGERKAETLSELTALSGELEKGAKLPPVEAMEGWFTRRGEAVNVAAVEEGPGRVVFVLAGGALDEVARMEAGRGRPRPREVVEVGRWDGELGRDHRFRFVWTCPEESIRSRDAVSSYPGTEDFTWRDGGVLWVAGHLTSSPPAGRERIAEAVATAGLTASERDLRRAVVLLVGSEPSDDSALAAEEAARFLQRLGVPFLVWSVALQASPVASRFGCVVDASTLGKFEKAIGSLTKLLDRQRTVWVVGSFLPHEIEPTPRAFGLVMVSRLSRPPNL